MNGCNSFAINCSKIAAIASRGPLAGASAESLSDKFGYEKKIVEWVASKNLSWLCRPPEIKEAAN